MYVYEIIFGYKAIFPALVYLCLSAIISSIADHIERFNIYILESGDGNLVLAFSSV